MKIEETIAKIKAIKKCVFTRITFYANPYPLAKGKDKGIKKICSTIVRFGLNYSHLKENANKETGGLNGKVWKEGETNYVLISEKTTKESLIEERLVSDRKSSKTPCFDLKIANIISIG